MIGPRLPAPPPPNGPVWICPSAPRRPPNGWLEFLMKIPYESPYDISKHFIDISNEKQWK